MTDRIPGIKYPTDIPASVDPSVHKAIRMLTDNVFHLRKIAGVESTETDSAAVAKEKPASDSGSGGKTESGETMVNGSTSGFAIFSQPVKEKTNKVIMIYVNNLTGRATYKFPMAFRYQPQILAQTLAGIVTLTSTTQVELTGAASTGFIQLSGY